MSQSIKTPTIVSSYAEGIEKTKTFFTEMYDLRHITVRELKNKTYECYTDSGSDDYFYFKIESE